MQTGKSGKVNRSFGLAASLEDAAGASTKRKDMTGSREVFRMTVWINGRTDCARPIVSRNAGRDAMTLHVDRDRERRSSKAVLSGTIGASSN